MCKSLKLGLIMARKLCYNVKIVKDNYKQELTLFCVRPICASVMLSLIYCLLKKIPVQIFLVTQTFYLKL